MFHSLLFFSQTLLTHRADINATKTSNGATSLYAAAQKGHFQCVEVGFGMDYPMRLDSSQILKYRCTSFHLLSFIVQKALRYVSFVLVLLSDALGP